MPFTKQDFQNNSQKYIIVLLEVVRLLRRLIYVQGAVRPGEVSCRYEHDQSVARCKQIIDCRLAVIAIL